MSHVNTRQHAQSETIKKDRVSKQIPKQKNQSLNELVYLYLLKSVNLFQDGTPVYLPVYLPPWYRLHRLPQSLKGAPHLTRPVPGRA